MAAAQGNFRNPMFSFPFCGVELPLGTCCSPCDAHELRTRPEVAQGRRLTTPGLGMTELDASGEIEIAVVVQRQKGEPWGIDVHHGSRGLIIDKIVKGGVFEAHNQRSEAKVWPKDRILEVNGKGRGDAKALLEECRNSDRIELLMSRHHTVLSRTVSGASQPSPGEEKTSAWTGLLPLMPGCFTMCSKEASGLSSSRDEPPAQTSTPWNAEPPPPPSMRTASDGHVFGTAPAAQPKPPPGSLLSMTTQRELNQVLSSAAYLVIDCFEEESVNCQQNAAIIEQLAKDHHAVLFATVDIKGATGDLVRELKVTDTPTVFLIHRGAHVEALPFVKPDMLRSKVAHFLENYVHIHEGDFDAAAKGLPDTVGPLAALQECRIPYADDSVYRGQMREGLRYGRGTWEHSAGFYSGNWKDDLFSKYGVQVYTDGRRYAGNFSAGQYHGEGTMEWTSDHGCMSYRGQYANGAKHGEGKFCWADGRSYSGYWVDGKRHGKGACATADGKVQLGEWHYDKLLRWLPDLNEPEDLFVKQSGCLLADLTSSLKTGLTQEHAKDFVKHDARALGFTYRNEDPQCCFVKKMGCHFDGNSEWDGWTTVTRLKLDSDLGQKLVCSVPADSLAATMNIHGTVIWNALTWVERWALLAPKALPDEVKEVAREAARHAMHEAAKAAAASPMPMLSRLSGDAADDGTPQAVAFRKQTMESEKPEAKIEDPEDYAESVENAFHMPPKPPPAWQVAVCREQTIKVLGDVYQTVFQALGVECCKSYFARSSTLWHAETNNVDKDFSGTSHTQRVLKSGDRVQVLKKSRLQGQFAVVINSDWNGMVKVQMDAEDSKGRTKSFLPSELMVVHESIQVSENGDNDPPPEDVHWSAAGRQFHLLPSVATWLQVASVIDNCE